MRRIHLFLLGLLCLAGLATRTAFAQITAVPNSMSFQGKLTQPSGTPVPDGSYSLQFSVYNALTGGTLLWQRSLANVPVKNGAFAAPLDFSSGFQNGATQSSLFGASTAYLEIAINGAAPLTPRQQLMTVAYAFKANSVPDGSITGASLANGTITVDKFASGAFNPLAWLLGGNSGTNSTQFLGTTDNQPLNFKVNNWRAMRYRYAENTVTVGSEYRSINIFGGSEINNVSPGVVGATISGGGQDNFAGPDYPNYITADFGTIGGGLNNAVTGYASVVSGGYTNIVGGGFSNIAGGVQNTVNGVDSVIAGGYHNSIPGNNSAIAGGSFNTVSGDNAIVIGGSSNTASGLNATVGGGNGNVAQGNYSFAAGYHASTQHTGCFAWGDSRQNDDIITTAPDQFIIRAAGGVKLPYGTYLELGYRRLGKQVNAGKIGYELFTDLSLDILGGGETNGQRKIKIWAEGGTTFTGNINVNGVNYNSDARYKQKVTTFPDALDTLLNLRGVTFEWDRAKWKERGFTEGRQIGFIAQEVEKILPELVNTDAQGYKSVAYANVVPILVEAVKTLKAQVDSQQTQIDALQRQQTEIAELKAQMAVLMAARKTDKRLR